MGALLIGMDAGGTKTALRIETPDGAVLDRLAGPGVNLQRDGLESSAKTLGALLGRALPGGGSQRVAAVCIGVAGAGRPADQAELRQAICSRLGDDALSLLVVHDAEIALEAAFGAESGVICVAGTGSVVYGRTDEGQMLRSGGWGARLGDPGSGTSIGRHALQAVAHALDGGPQTALSARVADAHGIHTADDLIHWTYREDGAFASLVPLVLEAAPDDAIADAILRLEADRLLQQICLLASQRPGAFAQRLAFFGGLSGEPVYRCHLDAALRRRLPRWRAVETTAEPVEGAVRRARRWADER